LWVIYREGTRWHALIHNEFHDPVASTCKPGDTSSANPCWYNSITYAVSTDGARTFTKPSPPAHVVAPQPSVWVAPTPGATSPSGFFFAEGYRAPSNIVRSDDGYYYALFESVPDKYQSLGYLCVMRSDKLDDPTSWRAWDGTGFNLRMTSPYVTGGSAPSCAGLSKYNSSGHLTYNDYLKRYMQVAQSVQWIDGRNVCGIFFALSPDLVHWSEQQLLAETNAFDNCSLTPTDPSVLETKHQGYASIIDHGDTTINFERAGRSAYLYYTRFNDGGLDRDLIRVPITFTRVD
jgi:hypothetical protein